MAKEDVQLTKTDSILDELTRLHNEISRRAYDFFCGPEGRGPLGDWFRAEQELVWIPAIELRQKNGGFELEASIAGVDPKNLDVQITPQDILIKGRARHRHETQEEIVHVCEFSAGQLFRSIHLPGRIDPDTAKAECRNGVLHLTVKVAKAMPRKIDVQAA
jgi:HSP20 family protein